MAEQVERARGSRARRSEVERAQASSDAAFGQLGRRPRPAAVADPLDWPRRGLSARSRRVCLAVAEALLSDEDEAGRVVPPPAATSERAVGALAAAIGRGSSDLRRGFAVLTFAMELAPLVLGFAFSRASRLPLARRVRFLESLESSRIGLVCMLFVAFKVPLCIPAFEEGEELALTGFDRPSTASRRSGRPASLPMAGQAGTRP